MTTLSKTFFLTQNNIKKNFKERCCTEHAKYKKKLHKMSKQFSTTI